MGIVFLLQSFPTLGIMNVLTLDRKLLIVILNRANPRKRPKRNYPMSKTKYRRDWFRMVVWLVTYYEFFCKKVITEATLDRSLIFIVCK